MPLIKCQTCNTPKHYSPSHIPNRAFCSRGCYSIIRNKELEEKGKETRLNGTENYPKTYHYGSAHFAWKGNKASYRALHYWLRRQLGKPTKCIKCNKESNKPRIIQWANIDGKYRRISSDYIPMCCSCHKLHDLNIRAMTCG